MQVLRSSMPWSVLGIVLLTGVSPLLAREHMAASSASDHVVAAVDVVLTHRVIEADGTQAIPISTESAFTLQKLRTGSGATKIRLTYRQARPGVSASARRTPLVGARVEYDPGVAVHHRLRRGRSASESAALADARPRLPSAPSIRGSNHW